MIDQGMLDVGYRWINLDDCWASVSRDPTTGAIRADPSRFPSGSLRPLSDWLHQRGFFFGMYTAAGNETCSTGGRTVPGKPHAQGVPASWRHYDQDAATFASWKIDYVKVSGLFFALNTV